MMTTVVIVIIVVIITNIVMVLVCFVMHCGFFFVFLWLIMILFGIFTHKVRKNVCDLMSAIVKRYHA